MFIYRLLDPRDNQVRYIGQTDNIRRRMYEHLRERRLTYKCNWIQSLKKQGLCPIVEIIEECNNANERESYWISYYLSQGAHLVNAKKINHVRMPKKKVTVYCYNKFGELVNVYDHVPYHLFRNVYNALNGIRRTAGGLIWSYTPIQVKSSGVYQYTLEGKFVDRYESIPDASRATGIKASSIYKCVSGTRQTGCGFIWKSQYSV